MMDEFSKELCSERTEAIKKRLDKHSDTLDELSTCSVKLTQMLEIHNDIIHDHEDRIDSLEKRPAGYFGKIIDALISAVVAGIVCLVL